MADAQVVVDTPDRSAAARWQFTLWDLFLLVTALGVALAIAVRVGPGSLSLSLGLILAWQNWRGTFRPAQTNQMRPRVFAVGWLLLCVSLVLPSAKGCNGKYVYGWQMAYHCALAETLPLDGGNWNGDGDSWRGWLYISAINLANLLMVLSPWFLSRMHLGHGERFIQLFAALCVPVWSVTWTEECLVGCYVWQASFAVLLAAQRIRGPTLAAMCVVVALTLAPATYHWLVAT